MLFHLDGHRLMIAAGITVSFLLWLAGHDVGAGIAGFLANQLWIWSK